MKEVKKMQENEIVEQFDALLEGIKNDLIEEELKTKIVDPVRMEQFMFCYKVAMVLAKQTGAKVYHKINEPIKGFGSVSIEGKRLRFLSGEWFSRASEFANNTEVYALKNGDIRITFGFRNIAVSA